MILFTNCSGYYTCELLGVSEKYTGLTLKRHSEKSIYRYLSQFDDDEPDPIFRIDEFSRSAGITFSQTSDLDKVAERFPCVELTKSALVRENGSGSLLGFGERFQYCILDECLFVNVREEYYRCKNVLHLMIVKNNVNSGGLENIFKFYMGEKEVHGMHCVPTEDVQRQLVAGQLQNLFLLRGLHETTLGEFFRLHPEVVHGAFKTTNFLYEPFLNWIEHDGTCEDVAINPDLLVRREDGFYDIYDLKTALVDKQNVTKGGRKRRRFIDYVEEGVAQLANYREYFTYPENAKFAREKYQIEVNAPNLVLVVGNWDNSDSDEVFQACRRYPDVKIIDYDTLCHLFLGATADKRQ
ncbi:hypothetical protein C9422_10060 [Pseudomonas sp. B1(2018)]|nr:hypothetical protein C9422_10060 [Pseudomonas sp. B1(2018)]